MNRYKAAVVGLGGIGLGYDYDAADDSRVLTHAAGFHCHPGFELAAGVDDSAAARERFTAKYGRPAFATVGELMAACRPEVVSVAVPTARHREVFEEVMAYGPRAVLAEKPLGGTLRDAAAITALAKDKGTLLLVNYIRRFEPGVLALKAALAAGCCGEIYKGTVWYSKGLANNGSHFIDLLIFLLGPVTAVRLLSPGTEPGPDPEPDFRLSFGAVDVYFLAGREACFSVKEIALLGTGGCVNYENGGARISVRTTVPHPTFPGYTVLAERGTEIATDFYRYQAHVTEALYRALDGGAPLASTGETALATLAAVEAVRELCREAR